MDKHTLLQLAMEDFCILNKLILDGDFGYPNTIYSDGATFKAVASVKNSTAMEIAYQQGLKRIYNLYFPPDEPIEQNTLIKRKADGMTFRINSAPDTPRTPSFSSIPLKHTTMEVITL